MSKYMILSFDDGKKNNYRYAYKLMVKYGVKASLHIGTWFTLQNDPAYLSYEEIKEMTDDGFDFSSHGHKHTNDKHDLAQSLACLKDWGLLDESEIVFSSPYSSIYEKNLLLYKEMLDYNNVKYVRTGTQVKRNGFFYVVLYCVQKIIKSKYLFYLLNKCNMQKKIDYFIKSIAVKNENTVKQLEYFINKIQDGYIACFLFHDILPQEEIDNGDVWSFSLEKFENFLKFITSKDDIKILTIKNAIRSNF